VNLEPTNQFESRKRDHIALALKDENEAQGLSGLDRVELIHEALPEINFSEISLQADVLGKTNRTPFLVSSMTAGHAASENLNTLLARACAEQGWMMGVGSQRRELTDIEAQNEWRAVRKAAPRVELLGNLGLSQVIEASDKNIQSLVDVLEARAMIVHLNPLQECLQPEGTPQFRGGLERLSKLAKVLSVPVIVKETGCGFSASTLQKLNEAGIAAVDVSGFGGTHWGRIEGQRGAAGTIQSQAALTFSNWGVNTYDSLINAQNVKSKYEIWASGGLRTGLDAAKTFALGARCAGFAKPILQAALAGEDVLMQRMQQIEFELKTALFCTGSLNITSLNLKKVQSCQPAI
jgi:isopentenyl-diphosphate Delta-isomerase